MAALTWQYLPSWTTYSHFIIIEYVQLTFRTYARCIFTGVVRIRERVLIVVRITCIV